MEQERASVQPTFFLKYHIDGWRSYRIKEEGKRRVFLAGNVVRRAHTHVGDVLARRARKVEPSTAATHTTWTHARFRLCTVSRPASPSVLGRAAAYLIHSFWMSCMKPAMVP